MMDRNHSYSITKLPALNMSNFFFTTPSSCDEYDKDINENLQKKDGINKTLIRQNDIPNGKVLRQNEVNRTFSSPMSHDQSNVSIDASFEIPEIQISTNGNLLDLPTIEENGNKIPVLESFPACSCLESLDDVDNRASEKSSIDESSSVHRTQSGQLMHHCNSETKLNKTRKKFIPIFQRVSKSIDNLDVVENESSNKTNKSPPTMRRRLHRGVSEPFIEPLTLRNDYSHTKSLMNIRSPFVGRKSLPKVNPEDERRKLHCEMLNCIRNDDCKGLRSLLKKRIVDVNVVTKDGSLIHEASYKGCTKCMKFLLKGGCYVTGCDELGWTALHAAVLSKSLDAIKLLLENYALPNQLNYDGLTPCHLAVIIGDLYITHELMKSGGDPLVKNTHITPFQLAIDLKQCVILDYFLHMPLFLVDL